VPAVIVLITSPAVKDTYWFSITLIFCFLVALSVKSTTVQGMSAANPFDIISSRLASSSLFLSSDVVLALLTITLPAP
jgi:hypothetical protein